MSSKLQYFIGAFNMLAFCFILYSFSTKDIQETSLNYSDKILKVRGIVVVDSLGIERVIVGAHLPDPNFSTGNRIQYRGKRGSMSGVMLYDSEGQERGGYVTDDNYGNAMLTLDSKTSQQFLLLAEPQGSAALQLWSRNGNNKISLLANDDEAEVEFKKNNKMIKLYSDEK